MEEAFKRQDPRNLSTENGLHRCYKNEESKINCDSTES